MDMLRWGILSTAKIAREKVIPAIQQAECCQVTAIGSRNHENAKLVAQNLGIAQSHGSYEALLDDPGIDAVYIPLPNHLHVKWALKAMAKGKHVLCEKPLGLNSKESLKLVQAAQQYPELKIMEAFMYRHHPQWIHAKQLIEEGEIGKLRTINSFFSYTNTDPDNVRNMPDIGGGGLMDIGCYCVSLARFLFKDEPDRVIGLLEKDPTFHTDRLASGILSFPSGTSTFTCSTQISAYQRVNIFGTRGHISIETPFNPSPDTPSRLFLIRGEHQEEIVFPACNQYTLQAELFARAVSENTPVPTDIQDGHANMLALDALRQSSEQGCWKKIKG